MKAILVGLLAVVALGGCGVGVEDPEGQQAATGTSQVALINNPVTGQPELVRVGGVDPHNALPQDPIPLFEGKTNPGNPPPDPITEKKPFR